MQGIKKTASEIC